MKFEGFVGGAYDLRNIAYSCQTCVNLYPEVQELGTGKQSEVAQLVSRKGLAPVITGLAGVSRGGYTASNTNLYWVFGTTLYRITPVTNSLSGWSSTALGTVGGGSNSVFMTDNGTDLFILAGTSVYLYNFASGVVSNATGGSYSASTSLDFISQYVVFSKQNSGQFYWTDPGSTTAPALNFATAEGNPDRLVGLINSGLDLWLFGNKTTEIWGVVGENNITFARRTNLIVETGCLSPRSIKKLGNTVAWMASSDRGGAQLMIANGYNPMRVSTYPIEQQWQTFSSTALAAAEAYVMQDGGHIFYVLNIPGSSETWVYDLTVSQQLGKPTWHVWQSSDGNGTNGRHRGQGFAFHSNWHITGDFENGILYAMDAETYTDNGNYITRERTTPHVSNEMKRVFYDEIGFDFLTGDTTDLSLDPQVMLQFSDDGGATWTDERWETCGRTGQYGLQVNYHRNGSARSRVFRIRMTDATYWAVSGAYLTIRPGNH